MISGKTQIAAAAAVIALSASVSAAPAIDVSLEARGPALSKVSKYGGEAALDIAHRKAVGHANDRINDHYGLNKPHVPAGLADAARKHQQALSSHGKKKRDLEDELYELFARGPGGSKVAKYGGEAALDIAHRKAVGHANDRINDHFGLNKPHVPAGLADAAKKHQQALSSHGKKKRDLEDELYELVARGPALSKVSKYGGEAALDIAHRKAVGHANDRINDHYGLNKPHVPAGLADAARKHQQALSSHGKKKRDLEDELYELFARGPTGSKVAKYGGEAALDIAHRKAVGHANDRINDHFGLNKPHVPAGLADAAKKHQQALSSHGKKKRDLEDEFEELFARGPTGSKVAKYGGEAALDIAHRKAVGHANDRINDHFGLNKPHVPAGLADAAKKHQQALSSHGKKKRDLEDEFDELVARGPAMSKVAKYGGDAAYDIAHRGAVNHATSKINDHFGLNKPHVHPGLADAARKATGPHDPKLVAAAVGHTRRKRDLAAALIDYIEARSFELDDLE